MLGALVFGFCRKVHLDDPKLRFVRGLGTSLSIALENARLFGAQRHVADRLQEALLQLPDHVAGIEYAAEYRAAALEARVGGDFYDLFEISEPCVAISIGDVAGKGLHAATLTALAKNALRAYILEDMDPALAFTKMNRLVHQFTSTETFLTTFLGVLDTRTGELTYCSAGHPPVVHLRPDRAERLTAADPILGAFPDLRYTAYRTKLGPRDSLVLYTDGLIEARRNGEFFGESRVLETLRGLTRARPDQLVAGLVQDVLSFSDGPLKDDVALLAVRLPRARPARAAKRSRG